MGRNRRARISARTTLERRTGLKASPRPWPISERSAWLGAAGRQLHVELVHVATHHGFTQVLAHFGTAGGVAALEDAPADEHAATSRHRFRGD
jgi:hypothetical protein